MVNTQRDIPSLSLPLKWSPWGLDLAAERWPIDGKLASSYLHPMSLRVGKIGHATLVVFTDNVRCLVDPILTESFVNGALVFNPPISVDVEAVRSACDAIIISHAHPDHFSPSSLAQLSRDCFVFYPVGSSQIAKVLERLGFRKLHPMRVGVKLELGDLEIFPTASRVPFPETGLLFRSGDARVWNCVDTVIDEDVVASVQDWVGEVDLMLASWQPLNQAFWNFNGDLASMRYKIYSRCLRAVFDTKPRCVVPSACGFEYTTPWLNSHGFPMSEQQFLDDIGEVMPELRTVRLPPGAVISADNFTLQLNGLPFVRSLTRSERTEYDWRPERGIPPLADPNLLGLSPENLRTQVAAYLDDELLSLICAPRHALWRERLAHMNVVWALDVVYPDETIESRVVHFRSRPLRWASAPQEGFAKIRTAIAASALVGIAMGEFDSYALNFGMYRVVMRLYSVNRTGVSSHDARIEEPLARCLFRDEQTTERMIERELRLLGL